MNTANSQEWISCAPEDVHIPIRTRVTSENVVVWDDDYLCGVPHLSQGARDFMTAVRQCERHKQ